MFERISHLAEHAATNVSRRQMLGALGRTAMVIAAAAAGLLALPGAADGKRPPRACDANPSSSCLGRNVGDVCFTGLSPEGANPCNVKAPPAVVMWASRVETTSLSHEGSSCRSAT
jgi:hypothetical protein